MQVFVIMTVQGRGMNPSVTVTTMLDTRDYPTVHEVYAHMWDEIVKAHGEGLRSCAVQYFCIQPDELEEPTGLELALRS